MTLQHKQRKIFIIGAGDGLGFELAKEFVNLGYCVFAGSRSAEKIEQLQNSVFPDKKNLIVPFIADVTDHEEVRAAFESLNLEKNEKVHCFWIAAGGLETIIRKIDEFAVELGNLAGDPEQEKNIEQLTQKVRLLTTSEDVLQKAAEINVGAPQFFLHLLENGNHIDDQSIFLTASSHMSDQYEVDDSDSYKGPWFYFPIAKTKAEGVVLFSEVAKKFNSSHIDIVAPTIMDTRVGKRIERYVTEMRKIDPTIPNPIVTKKQVVEAIVTVFSQEISDPKKVQKVYMTDKGLQEQKPDWKNPIFPYL